MKKILTALAAFAAISTPALAADMAARPYTKAPAPAAYVASWTGCYIAGGGGYGLFDQENTTYFRTPGTRDRLTGTYDTGGRGYFGTVGGGCDYQFQAGSWNWVVGAFGDYDFASIRGQLVEPFFGVAGREKLDSQWSAGGRLGLLITPQLLTYFSAGYTEAHFNGVTGSFNNFPIIGIPSGTYLPGQTYKGYFLGAGDEYALSFLPGLFWKTEYRFSDLDTKTNITRFTGTNIATGVEIDSHKYVHTVRSELVYRFNWGGAVVAKY